MGVRLAQLIFGAQANLGLILLPIMFYHPLQLFVCGLLANRFSREQVEFPRKELPVSSVDRANSY